MREYVKDEQRLQYLSSLAKWCGTLAGSSDAEVRQEFGRIQQMIARTISRDVIHSDGVFFYSHRPLPNADIEARLHQHGDDRPFNSLQGYLPFPPLKPKPKSKPKPSKKWEGVFSMHVASFFSNNRWTCVVSFISCWTCVRTTWCIYSIFRVIRIICILNYLLSNIADMCTPFTLNQVFSYNAWMYTHLSF